MASLPFVPDYDQWEPPSELIELLATMRRTRDKVEAVYAFYANDHKGQGPYASEIASVLGVNKSNVERRMTELISEGRAKKLHGKFVLVRGTYTHPTVRKLMQGEE